MLELPNQWLWDIVDEFIYQFQSYSQYRARLNKKTDEELDMLKKGHTVWNVHSVLNVLHSLVEKSNINKQLQVSRLYNIKVYNFLIACDTLMFIREMNNSALDFTNQVVRLPIYST